MLRLQVTQAQLSQILNNICQLVNSIINYKKEQISVTLNDKNIIMFITEVQCWWTDNGH